MYLVEPPDNAGARDRANARKLVIFAFAHKDTGQLYELIEKYYVAVPKRRGDAGIGILEKTAQRHRSATAFPFSIPN